jgi:hypothetical protein
MWFDDDDKVMNVTRPYSRYVIAVALFCAYLYRRAEFNTVFGHRADIYASMSLFLGFVKM